MKNNIPFTKRPESNWYTKTLVDYLCLNHQEWIAFVLMFAPQESFKSEEQLLACIKSTLVDYFFSRGINSGYFEIDEVDAVDWDAIANYLLNVNRSFWEDFDYSLLRFRTLK